MAHFDDYDLIIDARSPKEYAESHIPGAVNYYALDDDQHKEIGTLYKQVSPFEARVNGAAYVCLNAAEHIKKLYPAYTPKAKIAVYCARGGMRSSSLSTIFSSIGYRIDRLQGGYKKYRSFVLEYLDTIPKLDLIVLRGNTGCGKSDLLAKLENVIDLEGLANHYGSSFGALNGPQPTQKAFQNNLVHLLMHVDPTRPVFIEGESKRIGKVIVPKPLFDMMADGFQVAVTAPIAQRVERTVRLYTGTDDDSFYRNMERITPYIKRTAKAECIEAFARNDLVKVAEILLLEYYDTVYKKHKKIDYTLHNDDEAESLRILNTLQKERHEH
jgi:tRNA 2-selenouridine synthase